MKKIEVTLEQRMALEFEVTREEIEELRNGCLPDRIQNAFDKENWTVDSWRDFAVWDCDKEEQIVDWD